LHGAADESAKVSVQASSAIEEVTAHARDEQQRAERRQETQVQASTSGNFRVHRQMSLPFSALPIPQKFFWISRTPREEVVTGIQTMEKDTMSQRTNQLIQSSAEIINILGHRR